MWTPYEIDRKHKHDFKISYRFYLPDEGGRRLLPYQGYRCDFAYDGDDINKTGIFMIHPEFEDENGLVILNNQISVSQIGTARMWILIPEMRREVHIHRIKGGIKGYFMEGNRRVGEVIVIEVNDIMNNSKNII